MGIHDRKLYVLGLCRAISLGNVKPYVLSEVAGEILPSLLLIFEGLKRAYQSRAQEGEEEESDIEDGEDYEGLFFVFWRYFSSISFTIVSAQSFALL